MREKKIIIIRWKDPCKTRCLIDSHYTPRSDRVRKVASGLTQTKRDNRLLLLLQVLSKNTVPPSIKAGWGYRSDQSGGEGTIREVFRGRSLAQQLGSNDIYCGTDSSSERMVPQVRGPLARCRWNTYQFLRICMRTAMRVVGCIWNIHPSPCLPLALPRTCTLRAS